jgi:AraC-like DNA-binding protein
LALIANALEQADHGRVRPPATERLRRVLVDGAREALAAEPDRSLPELACELATSPHHPSRVFRLACGHTISRHRMRLRVRSATEHMAAAESELGRLAAEPGFADQSHMCRVIRAETGYAPVALRSVVGAQLVGPASGARPERGSTSGADSNHQRAAASYRRWIPSSARTGNGSLDFPRSQP